MAAELDRRRYSRNAAAVSETPEVDWERVRESFSDGDYRACRTLLSGTSGPRSQLWLARLDLRAAKYENVFSRLLSLEMPDRCMAAERDLCLGKAYQSTGESERSNELFDRAIAVLKGCDAEQYFSALNARALSTYIADDYPAAKVFLDEMIDSPHPNVRALALEQLGWFRARQGDLPGQLGLMLRALDEAERAPLIDQHLYGNLLSGTANLCRELPPGHGCERVVRASSQLKHTEGTAFARFTLQRALGWIAVLNGDELEALRRWRAAEVLSPSPFWRVFCLVDRASLAAAMGHGAAALQTLNAADIAASLLPWSSTQAEERIVLIMLARLFAERSPARAQRYLALFRSLSKHMNPRLAFSRDRRLRALQAHPQGVALLHLGETEAGISLLQEAWTIFTEFDYRWRAALAALDLYKATADAAWLHRAREQIAPWPRSWIWREVERADAKEVP